MKRVNGVWWPDADRHCHTVVPKQVRDLDRAIPICRKFDCAVQAGGNVGIWSRYLRERFESVWTFEPDFDNYCCLRMNVTGVTAIHAALGRKAGACGMERDAGNVGAHYIVQGNPDTAVLALDDLELPHCDLLVLDTEGNEPDILVGARRTIERCRPVLMIEDKGLSERVGVPKGWTADIPGYAVHTEVHRDVILVPE